MNEPHCRTPESAAGPAPEFDAAFRDRLLALFRWRRDVRRFRRDPIDEATLERLVAFAALAPSVGYSQPWRFVLVADEERRAAVRDSYRRCNAAALADFSGERAALYARLKLAGLDDAPVQLAVFVDHATAAGHGVGRRTMPQTLRDSVVAAVHGLWLAARAEGIGVGWVSILEPEVVAAALDVPAGWELVAYLCIGHPQEQAAEPELQRVGWQDRDPAAQRLIRR